MRIAFIGSKSFPSQAGVDRVVEAIVRELAERQNYELVVYGDAGKLDPACAPPRVKLVEVMPRGGKYLKAFSQFLISAWLAFWDGKFDLVHLHNLEACYVLPLLRLRYPVIVTSHIVTHRRVDQWSRAARFLIRSMEWPFMHLSSSRTAVSKVDSDYYAKKHHKPVDWIPNGVDAHCHITPEKRASVLKKYGLEDQGYLLFAAGRIIPTKGCDLFLHAAARLGSQLAYTPVVVGDLAKDPTYGELLRAIAPPGTIFIPFISDKSELDILYACSRLLVFPSLVEGMSMVLLESVVARARLVCSDIPENKTVLNAETLFFRSGDLDDLADKIDWALTHIPEMDARAEAAYRYVAEHYAWSNIVQEYILSYDKIAKR